MAAQLYLPDLGIEPNGAPRPVLLPLGKSAPGASLQLTVQWLRAPPKKPDPFVQAEARLAAGSARAAPSVAAQAERRSPGQQSQSQQPLQQQRHQQQPVMAAAAALAAAAVARLSPQQPGHKVAASLLGHLRIITPDLSASLPAAVPTCSSAPASPMRQLLPARSALSFHRRAGSAGVVRMSPGGLDAAGPANEGGAAAGLAAAVLPLPGPAERPSLPLSPSLQALAAPAAGSGAGTGRPTLPPNAAAPVQGPAGHKAEASGLPEPRRLSALGRPPPLAVASPLSDGSSRGDPQLTLGACEGDARPQPETPRRSARASLASAWRALRGRQDASAGPEGASAGVQSGASMPASRAASGQLLALARIESDNGGTRPSQGGSSVAALGSAADGGAASESDQSGDGGSAWSAALDTLQGAAVPNGEGSGGGLGSSRPGSVNGAAASRAGSGAGGGAGRSAPPAAASQPHEPAAPTHHELEQQSYSQEQAAAQQQDGWRRQGEQQERQEGPEAEQEQPEHGQQQQRPPVSEIGSLAGGGEAFIHLRGSGPDAQQMAKLPVLGMRSGSPASALLMMPPSQSPSPSPPLVPLALQLQLPPEEGSSRAGTPGAAGPLSSLAVLAWVAELQRQLEEQRREADKANAHLQAVADR